MSKKLLWTLLQYCLAFGLLAFVIAQSWDRGNPNGLHHLWTQRILKLDVDFGYLFLAFFLFAIALSLTLVRWYFLVLAVGLPFRIRDAFRLGIIGFFYNSFLPGSVGGDVVKAAFLAREHDRRTLAVATVIMDRIFSLWALIWFVAISGSIFWSLGMLQDEAGVKAIRVVKVAGLLVIITFGIWRAMGLFSDDQSEAFAKWLSRAPKVGPSLGELWRAVWTYRRRELSVALCMFIAWVGHVFFVLVFYCSVRAFAPPSDFPGLIYHFLIVPIGLVIEAAPFFPGGAGIGELGFKNLYGLFAPQNLKVTAESLGVTGSLIKRILMWIIGFVGYLVYLSTRTKVEKQTSEDEADPKEELPSPTEPVPGEQGA